MSSSTEWWSIVIDVGIGLGVFLIGLGIFVVCVGLRGLLNRLHKTLDEVDTQIGALSTPIATTLTHVGGIADTADQTIARLGGLVNQLETVAAGASKTANLIGSTLGGLGAQSNPRAKAGPKPDAGTPGESASYS